MTYQQITAEIEAKGVFPTHEPTLEYIRAALVKSGLMDKIDPARVIVVAGTNGKGSTCATLYELLKHAAQKVCLYTSPHIISTTERIRLPLGDISQDDFVRIYAELKPVIEECNLSHFETLTLMAVQAFLETDPDWMIFEVGLGGIWDATNAIPHDWCVITPLDFDHMHMLGNTITDIARNKFGIIGNRNIVAYAPLPPEVMPLQKQTQLDTHSVWLERLPFTYHVENDKTSAPEFFIAYKDVRAKLALPGQRGAENAALALTAFDMIGFDPSAYLYALQNVKWPGRMERIDAAGWNCPVYLSGDHNPHGIASLLEILQHYKWNTLHLVAGIGQHRNLDEMLGAFASIPNTKIYLTRTPFKGLPMEEYGAWLDRAVYANENVTDVLAFLKDKAQPDDMVLVTGSLYLVGEVRALLIEQKEQK